MNFKSYFLIKYFRYLVLSVVLAYQSIRVTISYLQYKTVTTMTYQSTMMTDLPSLCFAFPFTIPLTTVRKELNEKNLSLEILKEPNSFEFTLIKKNTVNQWIQKNFENKRNKLLEYNYRKYIRYIVIVYRGTNAENSREKFNLEPLMESNELIAPGGWRGTIYFSRISPNVTEPIDGVLVSNDSGLIQRFKQEPFWFHLQNMSEAIGDDDYFCFGLAMPGIKSFNWRHIYALNINSRYVIDFHTVTIRRLEPLFETSCFRYDGRPGFNETSKNDCVVKCLLDLAENKPLDTHRGFYGYFLDLDRYYRLMSNRKVGISTENRMKYSEAESHCEALCPNDCFEIRYDLFQIRAYNSTGMPFSTEAFHHHWKDVTIEHFQELDFFTYLGGLAGIWLGFSFADGVKFKLDKRREKNRNKVEDAC